MSAFSALNIAIEAAERKRDDARQLLAERQKILQSAQAQMDQLTSYQAEMAQRWGPVEGGEFRPELMYHHDQFMQRLAHATTVQSRVIKDHSIRLEAAQQALMAAELRLTSLKKVVQTRQRDLELAQMRRDQKQTDERAALQFIGRSLGLQIQA